MRELPKSEKVALFVYLLEVHQDNDGYIYNPSTRELMCSRDQWNAVKHELGWSATDPFLMHESDVRYMAYIVANHFFTRKKELSYLANKILFEVANPCHSYHSY